jgi:hypothetical protein
VDTVSVEKVETDDSSPTERIGDRELDFGSSRFDGADLAIVSALLYPDVVLVREQGGEGTSVMRREANGSWYFVD